MCDKMKCFENYDYKFISNMIENKVYKLKQYEDYNKKYKELFDRIDNLEATLSEKQKDDFNKIVKLFYETEEYYFAFSYYLGEKHANPLHPGAAGEDPGQGRKDRVCDAPCGPGHLPARERGHH